MLNRIMKYKNQNLSPNAELIFKKVMFKGDSKEIFNKGVSDDTMAFFIKVSTDTIEVFLSKYPEIKDTFTISEFDNFKSLMYEAIGLGFHIYYAEKIYVKRDAQFSKHTGTKFMKYLNKKFNEYFVTESKNPDEITPPYIVEVAKQLAFTLFNEGIIKAELAKKELPQEFIDSSLMQLIWLILMGYDLSVLQEEY